MTVVAIGETVPCRYCFHMAHTRPFGLVLAFALLLAGCGQTQPADRAGSDSLPDLGSFFVTFMGRWEITPVAAGGPSLAIQIDSVGPEGFAGHLTWALAGDVVDDPARYLPFTGTFAPDSTARFEIFKEGIENPVYRLRVRPVGDVLALLEYEWGGQRMLEPGRRWLARRVIAR